MRYADDDSLTGLDTARRGRQPQRRWTGTLSQRARASRGLPQAVFKISSYSRSGGAVLGRFEYITREGKVEAEGPNGERLDQGELAALVDEWSEEAEARRTRQYAMSAIVSFPKGVDEEQATEAARQFFREAFADNHDYVFAPHRDRENFHVHVVVQSAGHDGKQLRIRRDDLQDLRMLFAEKAAEQGIALDASPRWARGLDREPQLSPKVEGIMRRWRDPELELAGELVPSTTRRTQLEALVAVRRDRDPDAPAVSPLEYARAAEIVAGQAQERETPEEKVEGMKAAVQLARFGLQLTSSLRSSEHFNAADAAAAEHVAAQVDKAVSSQIRDLPDDAAPALKRAAWSARQPLAEQLAAGRPEPERRWAREAEGQAEARPEAGECQALEYARSAAGVVGQLYKLENDPDRTAAVKASVSLARFGWELSEKDQGTAEERGRAREILDQAERALRFGIERIEDPQAKREAIQARQTLYHAGVKEYRAERRETERAERAAEEARGRDEGWER